MTYIYDILLNFNKELIEFFLWEDSDNIKYVKKIALFKVNPKVLKEIIENEVVFDSEFTNIIPKYEMNENKDNNRLCLLTDGLIVIGILINNRKVVGLSRLLLDEEQEALELMNNSPNTTINYKKISTKTKKNNFLTRKEQEIKEKLEKEIEHLYINKNFDKLRYFYYEFTGKEHDNFEYIYKFLKKSFDDFGIKHLKLFDILLLQTKTNANNE